MKGKRPASEKNLFRDNIRLPRIFREANTMTIEKIVSGGQTGADQAALDTAIKLDIPHGGWIPRGRMTESGPLPEKYRLREMPTDSYALRTEQNVIDSDGTLIVSRGRLTGGSEYTREMALKHRRPHLHVNLEETNRFQAVLNIVRWLQENRIRTLNVAGPRASKDPGIQAAVGGLLEAVITMEMGRATPEPAAGPDFREKPETVAAVVAEMVAEMSLKDKATLSNMTAEELTGLRGTLGVYLRNNYLYPRNDALLEACRKRAGDKYLHWDQAPDVIIRALWEKLSQTHKLRLIK
jgi:hypothetical protein